MLGISACNACGGSLSPWLFIPLDTKKNAPIPYSSVLKCDRCGIAALHPLPEPKDIPGFYDLPGYYTHGESDRREIAPSFVEKVLTKAAWTFDKSEGFDVPRIAASMKPDARICDLGCGHGAYLRQFKELGFEVIGVEPDVTAREQANAAGITVLEGTAEEIPSDLGTFDLVLCTHALEHCINPFKAMKNVLSLTKPGGMAYIEVPNCGCEHFETFTICSDMFDAPRHIHFFDTKALEGLAHRVGFSVRKRLFSGYVRDFDPQWRFKEAEIARKLTRSGCNAKWHTLRASLSLFIRSFWKPRNKKYDCVGLILTPCSD